MSPAPETLRRPSNHSSSPPPISISSILSRSPRSPDDSPGPFSADRRASSSIRRNFSGGPRPAPFQRPSQTTTSNTATHNAQQPRSDESAASTRAMLISALETRRRRVEELRGSTSGSTSRTNIATTIADQWRRQRDEVAGGSSYRNGTFSGIRSVTPPHQTSPPQLLFNEDTSDSDSEDDDDPDNKFSSSMNEIRRTPPPTFATPNQSPSNNIRATPSSPQQDDDSTRNAYTLTCKFCANVLTKRGMRARLVADSRVHIWSTDEQPSVKLVGQSYATTTCRCQLIDIACSKCETVVGYHIAGSKPCDTCSRSNHNAHYHLLRTNQTIGVQNLNLEGYPMSWGDIGKE